MAAISRDYLHNIIGAADAFLSHTIPQNDKHTAALVRGLIGAAAGLDGRLSELSEDKKTVSKNQSIFRSRQPWKSRWIDSSQTFHKDDYVVTITLSQQILTQGDNAKVVGTDCYRVSVDDDKPQYAVGACALRKLVKSVLRDLRLTEQENNMLLEGFFG